MKISKSKISESTQNATVMSSTQRRRRLLEYQEKCEAEALYNGDLKPSGEISFSIVGKSRKTGY
ncbi:hypothetical protein FIV04_25770 (plasmid) [Vibrio sp. THAF190c]|nr:hypothetical protein FIV04_25770 [Vibrio sp. THAF190c]